MTLRAGEKALLDIRFSKIGAGLPTMVLAKIGFTAGHAGLKDTLRVMPSGAQSIPTLRFEVYATLLGMSGMSSSMSMPLATSSGGRMMISRFG